ARELREGLKAAVVSPDEASIYWISLSSRDGSPRLHVAPLNVGPALNERLFVHKDSLILTGATLSTENNLEYIKERLQLDEPRELLLGSPFDYPRLVMAYIPKDIPEPNHPGYMDALASAVAGVGELISTSSAVAGMVGDTFADGGAREPPQATARDIKTATAASFTQPSAFNVCISRSL
ncbi:MAG: hypothetical protein IIB21_05725, partial [Chloroflexi bacterium]|nr:hypothetical protein [Chloroflexota bacterium]